MASATRENHSASLLQDIESLEAYVHTANQQSDVLSFYCRELPKIGETARQAGFPGVLDICLIFQDCLQQLLDSESELAIADYDMLTLWPALLKGYLISPATDSYQQGLVQHLCHQAWGEALAADDAELLKSMLSISTGVAPVTEKDKFNDGSALLDEDNLLDSGMASLDSSDKKREEKTLVATVPQAEDLLDGGDGLLDGGDDLLDGGGGASDTFDLSISETLPEAIREILAIMAAELLTVRDAIQHLSIAERDAAGILLESLQGQMQRYAEALSTVDFVGLATAVTHTHTNLVSLNIEEHETLTSAVNMLSSWPQHILAYLKDPTDIHATDALLVYLQDSHWPQALSSDKAVALKKSLSRQSFAAVEEAAPERQKVATDEDVSLTLQDDVSQDLLEGLLEELPGQTEEFSAAIQRLTTSGDLEDIIIAKRVAHTLKGAANTVGVRGIATLTHHLEDILLILSKHETLPSMRISQTLMTSSDCLAAMSENLLGMGKPPHNAREILQEVLDLINLVERDGIEVASQQDMPAPKRDDKQIISPPKATESKAAGTREASGPMMRVPSDFVDNLLRLVGEAIIMTGQVRDRVDVTRKQIRNMQEQFDQLRQLGGRLEEIVDVKDLTKLQESAAQASDYDSLEMDQYSELHTCSKRLVEAAVDANEEAKAVSENLARLDEMLVDQSRLNNETQEGVMRARMVAVDSQFPRLQRSVRQAARVTAKEVEVHFHGGETLVDADTLNNLLDPLMHLLRNAVDHGIEDSKDRLAAGKTSHGNIHLEFLREGNQILVRCQDDGKGLNYGAIRKQAIEQGLYRDEDDIPKDELKQLILRSNFSTSTQITQVSGRGIGMDAVYASVMQMSGSFNIDSASGQGCTVEIKLPQTLVSSYVLLVRSGPQLVAIANRGIVQIIHHESGRLVDYGGKSMFQLDEQSYTARPLEELINMVFERRQDDRQPRSILLVENEQGKHAVLVEKIIASQDLVVKGLGHYVPKLTGVLGVTILGDGSVTPVIDLTELLRVSTEAGRAVTRQYKRAANASSTMPSALVVDDSLSARRSLAQFMQDAGYDVRMARDGMEAFEIIKARKPDILLSDLEMPRMSGLELIGHIRADNEIADIPFIMITSRAAAKHQQEAMTAGVDAYLTKPYSEDELLEKIQSLRV